MAKKIQPKRIENKVILPCRLSYVHLDAPWSKDDKNEKKYQVSCIISKEDTDTVAAVNAAVAKAKEMGKASKWNGKVPMNLKVALHDGDTEREDEAYKNAIFFNASSKKPVPTLNRLKETIDPAQIYSGCYGVVSVTFFPYSGASNGVGVGLNAVLKTEDGDPLGGSGDGKKDFDGMDFAEDLDAGLGDL